MGYYEPVPGHTNANFNDGTSDYFGKAAKGCGESTAGWQIFKMEAYVNGTASGWTIKYPVDSITGISSSEPKFVWGVNGSNLGNYTFRILGT